MPILPGDAPLTRGEKAFVAAVLLGIFTGLALLALAFN
jgi:hypothetical protein